MKKNKFLVGLLLIAILILTTFTSLREAYSYKLEGSATLNVMKYNNKRKKVCLGGDPVGIKLNTKGVLVVGFSDIISDKDRKKSPAAEAGVQIGDSILKINGETIDDSKKLAKIIDKGSEFELTLLRNNKLVTRKVTPVKNSIDGKYKFGVWIRDSTAGVGTLTFYDNASGKFAALGHPITDVDTGTILKVKDGNIIDSTIISVKKGVKGEPGEIRGIFLNEDSPIGKIEKNTLCGVYGSNFKNDKNAKKNQIEVAYKDEVKEGEAKIYTTINGENPRFYNIKIEKVYSQESTNGKSMIIKVTDKELLKKTGGIVQGMSGSPIVQNNRIVGAVTHVLINNPDTGYGIYAEWMLKEAGMMD